MKKFLTEEQFYIAINKLKINEKTKNIAYQVLVKGIKQIDIAKKLEMSKGNVSQAVNKVFNEYKRNNLPNGYEEVTVILPAHKAFIVKQWNKK